MFKRIPLNFLVSWASLRSNFQQEPLSPRSKTTEQLLRDISILQDRVSSVVPFESDLTSLTSLKENERCHLLIRWTLDLFHSIRHFWGGSSCIAFLGQAVFSSILCMSTITRVNADTFPQAYYLWAVMLVDCWTGSRRKICLMRSQNVLCNSEEQGNPKYIIDLRTHWKVPSIVLQQATWSHTVKAF